MLHESDLEQKINVTDVDINFESIYEKDYDIVNIGWHIKLV